MNEPEISAIATWIAEAGLAGIGETALLDGFCSRCCASGLDLVNSLAIIDTLHPTFEGRAFRWRIDSGAEAPREYGRTDVGEAAALWRSSIFYELLETGGAEYHARFESGPIPYPQLEELRPEGLTSLFAQIHRFSGAGVFGDMDCVYAYWATRKTGGFNERDMEVLRRLTPTLALAIKSMALARVTTTLAEVYLGRGAGRRVLAGRILRGVAERMESVLWFSDLRGFTSITDRAEPDDIIPLLNDYADAVITAIQAQGGDVLKLIGDGVLAMFEAERPEDGCRRALAAEADMRERVEALNRRRANEHKPSTTVYIGLHVGEVFFGNIGSADRLDFTVVGPAVNEASRIASLCRSVDRTVLLSSSFAALVPEDARPRLASVGRFALRGIQRAQELYTIDATG